MPAMRDPGLGEDRSRRDRSPDVRGSLGPGGRPSDVGEESLDRGIQPFRVDVPVIPVPRLVDEFEASVRRRLRDRLRVAGLGEQRG